MEYKGLVGDNWCIFNPFSAEENKANIIAADALSPCVARISAAVIMTM